MSDITAPVKPDVLREMLTQIDYDPVETQYLVRGFTEGFRLEYTGPRDKVLKSPNLKLTVGDHTTLWNKVMAEVKIGRFAGPFKQPPFKYFIQSPIGLVPKDQGTKTRLIFHLSYPRNDTTSVNANTPKHLCTVKYPDFEKAVKMCVKSGKSCKAAKSDFNSCF